MSQAGSGTVVPMPAAPLDDIARWRQQEGADDSRVASIHHHRMIIKAIQQGATPDQIASALNIPMRTFRRFLKLLLCLNDQAVDLLKDNHVSRRTMRLLRRVNKARQLEIAEMMVCAANYSSVYVEALVLGTPEDQLAQPGTKKSQGISPETIARMEREMGALERELKAIKTNYGENVLNLTLARAYVRKLLNNAAVAGFLKAHYADIHAEFNDLVEMESL